MVMWSAVYVQPEQHKLNLMMVIVSKKRALKSYYHLISLACAY